MDKIKASNEGRIINVSSMAHTMKTNSLNFDDLMLKNGYDPWLAYMQSKLANIYFTRELSKRLVNEQVTHVKVVSLHPGVIRTELGRNLGNKCLMYSCMCLCLPCAFMFTLSPWRGAQN
jgi:NAD(P)-dependent dehydrogenase (short-subunit alcohol dehydrogenase family)